MSADTTRDRLWLTADDRAIEADGTDATRITFRALDAYGNQRPHVTGEVTLAIAGPATLIGDNPFPFAAVRRGRRRLHPLPARPDRPGDGDGRPSVARPGGGRVTVTPPGRGGLFL